MNWDIWYGVEEILLDSSVCPILAVVPDNQDDALNVGAVNPKFWQEVHVWQARHWTIGLHGYQHHYTTRNSGLLGLSKLSEFAGLTAREQEERIGKAMGILEREEVAADIWVAPGHSFDATTLRILQSVGLTRLSDGFSLYPCLDPEGMLWIPQQLWRFRSMPFGLWTICLHLNRWTRQDLYRFRMQVTRFKHAITDFSSVISRYRDRQWSGVDSMFSCAYRKAFTGKRRLAANSE